MAAYVKGTKTFLTHEHMQSTGMKQIDMNVTVFFHLKWQNEKFHQDKP
jgi:hypothetical protein